MRPSLVLFGSLIILLLPLGRHGLADPLNLLMKEIPGSESLWEPLPLKEDFPHFGRSKLRLSFSSGNLVRYKIDGVRKYFLTSAGSGYEFVRNNGSSFFSFRASALDTTVALSGGNNSNHLTCDKRTLFLEGGIRVPMNKSSSLLGGGSFSSLRLPGKGKLTSLSTEIPGFSETSPAELNWMEDGWEYYLTYLREENYIGALYSENSINVDTRLSNVTDSVVLEVHESTKTLGLYGGARMGKSLMVKFSYREGDGFGSDGIFKSHERLGPVNLKSRFRHIGFSISELEDDPSWVADYMRGEYSVPISASSSLEGFGGPVFGIISPRVHVNSFSRTTLSTALLKLDLGKLLGDSSRLSLGATRWDIDTYTTTWESLLFGSAKFNEKSHRLSLESGWLAHVGLEATWELSPHTSLIAFVGQSVPIRTVVARKPPIPPAPPAPAKEKSLDGGRFFSLTYAYEF